MSEIFDKQTKKNQEHTIPNETSATTGIISSGSTTVAENGTYPSYDMMGKADVPYGAKSFADVAAAREATDLLERLEDTTSIFYSLFWNIWCDPDIGMSEKTSAWRMLFNDFSTAFESEIGAEEAAMEELDDFAENFTGSIIKLSESDKQNGDARKPLRMDIAVIEPGWGNPKDAHYYPSDVIRRDAHIFEGAKMYATDHRPEEKSVRTEVGKVERIIKFSETGAPIARVKIWNPDFAEDIRNRSKIDELGSLEVSILAKGKAKSGKIDGKDAKIVEAIIPSKYTNVDFVTSAGAGGRALQLIENEKEVEMNEERTTVAENELPDNESATDVQEFEDVTLHENEDQTKEDETQETDTADQETVAEVEDAEPEYLSEANVESTLAKSKLPEISVNRLAKIQYLTEAELQKAIEAESDYIKQLIGSGEPRGLGETVPVEEHITAEQLAEDHKKRIDAIIYS